MQGEGGAVHALLLHPPLWQSAPRRHIFPPPHGEHDGPPQSMSVS
jgi:hypothetical protein